MKPSKVSRKSKGKIQFYLEHGKYHKFNEESIDLESAKRKYSCTMISKFIPETEDSGYSSEIVFFNYESQGKQFPCKLEELPKLFNMFHGKKMIDLLIDMISDDIRDGLFFPDDMVQYSEYPKWFKTGIVNFSKKKGGPLGIIKRIEYLNTLDNVTKEDVDNTYKCLSSIDKKILKFINDNK